VGGGERGRAEHGSSRLARAGLVAVTLLTAVMATAFSPPADAGPGSTTTGPTTTGSATTGSRIFYLSLGDSVPVWDGSHSFPRLLLTHYGRDVPKLTLVNMAVSEATTTSMLDTGQYTQALQFLHKHQGRVALITIDIGGNDIVHCASATGIDQTCVSAGLASVTTNLTTMVGGLRSAAPGVPIIGMEVYDPYLGDWLAGGAARTLALATIPVATALNGELSSLYGSSSTADVADAFQTTDDTTLVHSPWGRVPVDVDRACSWLWIVCRPGHEEGFADDPTSTGQVHIAAAFEHTIGRLSAP
jgi:lysophospholipase L1-like esterase